MCESIYRDFERKSQRFLLFTMVNDLKQKIEGNKYFPQTDKKRKEWLVIIIISNILVMT